MKALGAVSLVVLVAAGLWWITAGSRPARMQTPPLVAKTVDAPAAQSSSATHKTEAVTTTLPHQSPPAATPAAGEPQPVGNAVVDDGSISVERLRDVGANSAAEAIESWLWSLTQGDAAKLQSLTRPAQRPLQATLDQQLEREMQAGRALRTFRMHEAKRFGEDRLLVMIEFNGSGRREPFLMTRTGKDGSWQRDLDPRAYK